MPDKPAWLGFHHCTWDEDREKHISTFAREPGVTRHHDVSFATCFICGKHQRLEVNTITNESDEEVVSNLDRDYWASKLQGSGNVVIAE